MFIMNTTRKTMNEILSSQTQQHFKSMRHHNQGDLSWEQKVHWIQELASATCHVNKLKKDIHHLNNSSKWKKKKKKKTHTGQNPAPIPGQSKGQNCMKFSSLLKSVYKTQQPINSVSDSETLHLPPGQQQDCLLSGQWRLQPVQSGKTKKRRPSQKGSNTVFTHRWKPWGIYKKATRRSRKMQNQYTKINCTSNL